jgi:hypothetical protein
MRRREVSKLTLCRLSDDVEIVLTLGQITYLPQFSADVASTMENRSHRIAKGQELLIRGMKLKVFAIGKDGVTISDERGVQTRLPPRQ